MAEESTQTVKHRLGIGRTLAVLDVGATLVCGGALLALSATTLPLAFGAAAVAVGAVRTFDVIKGWKKPETFVLAKTETEVTSTDAKGKKVVTNTEERRFGKTWGVIGAVAKGGAGLGLLGSLAATGGLVGAGLAAIAGSMVVVGGVGAVIGLPAVVIGVPLLAFAVGLKLGAGVFGAGKKSKKEAAERTPFASKFKPVNIKAAFNRFGHRMMQPHKPVLSMSLSSKASTSTTYTMAR